jgi:hypothetical protein
MSAVGLKQTRNEGWKEKSAGRRQLRFKVSQTSGWPSESGLEKLGRGLGLVSRGSRVLFCASSQRLGIKGSGEGTRPDPGCC